MLKKLAEKLIKEKSLSLSEYEYLIENQNEEITSLLRQTAEKLKREIYGDKIYLRALIEISNICKNDCYYCGIRKSNKKCKRYRLSREEILNTCEKAYNKGFRTFVLQGGEDAFFSDGFLVPLIEEIKKNYPDCAITLSLGERSFESYKALKQAGADRYLLRHETAHKAHYELLHPNNMNFHNRMECLENLKKLGYQTGCGFMVGSPFSTAKTLAKDLKFIENFSPEMCGIGPFIPAENTPFQREIGGTAELCLFCLSIIRIIKPNILLPATTALNSMESKGRILGIKHGANVVMPNLTPPAQREKYTLYNGKISEENLEKLEIEISSIGHKISMEKGDIKNGNL